MWIVHLTLYTRWDRDLDWIDRSCIKVCEHTLAVKDPVILTYLSVSSSRTKSISTSRSAAFQTWLKILALRTAVGKGSLKMVNSHKNTAAVSSTILWSPTNRWTLRLRGTFFVTSFVFCLSFPFCFCLLRVLLSSCVSSSVEEEEVEM